MYRILLGYLLLMSTLITCTGPKTTVARDPIWGKQECGHCRMVLSEKRYAAQYIEASGKVHFYDDIGCAVAHAHQEGFDVNKIWVRPHPQTPWALASASTFQGGLTTPMNSGFGAVSEGGSLQFVDVLKKLEGGDPSHGAHSH